MSALKRRFIILIDQMRNVNISLFHIHVLLDNVIVSVEWKGQEDGQEGSSPLNVRGYRTKKSFW